MITRGLFENEEKFIYMKYFVVWYHRSIRDYETTEPLYSCFIRVRNHQQPISTTPKLRRESEANEFES